MTKSETKLLIMVLIAVAVFVASVWFMFTPAHAAPFLVCDPQENVTSYAVTMDDTTVTVLAQDLGDNTGRLYYDLDGIENGSHNCTVKAKNMWGESANTPFSFSKIQPESPSVLDISAQ